MRQASALIQPTLFEGGPGGGSVYDAMAVGTRAIVSDIPVNREIRDSHVTFFPAGSAQELANAMREVVETKPDRITPEQLRRRGCSALKSFGKQLVQAVQATMDAGI
jgi:glycosyltransferase involved in cell wall biosynthesis